MANGSSHRLVAAITLGSAYLYAEAGQQEKSAKPLVAATLAAGFTNLPDILEPALHPNHRQFFHSVTFAGLLGWAAYKAYRWEPKDQIDEAIRFACLVGTAAYLVHLVMDAGTARSLPLIGKL